MTTFGGNNPAAGISVRRGSGDAFAAYCLCTFL